MEKLEKSHDATSTILSYVSHSPSKKHKRSLKKYSKPTFRSRLNEPQVCEKISKKLMVAYKKFEYLEDLL